MTTDTLKTPSPPRNGDKPLLRDYLSHGVFLSLYGCVKYLPPPVGSVLRWLVAKPFFEALGRVRFYDAVTIWYPYRIRIGDRTTVNEQVYLNGFGGLVIGNDVRIGHGTSILTSDHVLNDASQPIWRSGLRALPTVIEDDVFLGCRVVILGGVTIGRGSVAAAGAVITGDVPPNSIVAGVPARVVGQRGDNTVRTGT